MGHGERLSDGVGGEAVGVDQDVGPGLVEFGNDRLSTAALRAEVDRYGVRVGASGAYAGQQEREDRNSDLEHAGTLAPPVDQRNREFVFMGLLLWSRLYSRS